MMQPNAYLTPRTIIEKAEVWDIKECYGLLKPGSEISISTPDLVKLFGLFNPEKTLY